MIGEAGVKEGKADSQCKKVVVLHFIQRKAIDFYLNFNYILLKTWHFMRQHSVKYLSCKTNFKTSYDSLGEYGKFPLSMLLAGVFLLRGSHAPMRLGGREPS